MAETEDSRKARKRATNREWAAANREQRKEYMRAWRKANRAHLRAEHRAWRAANHEKAMAWGRRRYAIQCTARPFHTAYNAQRNMAIQRGIPFLLTFEEWTALWLQSGKWEQRGRRRGQYVMARFSDSGPYAVGNVRICTGAENIREMTEVRRRHRLPALRISRRVLPNAQG